MPAEAPFIVIAAPLAFRFLTVEEAAAFARQQTTDSGVAHFVCGKPLQLFEKKETTHVTEFD